MASVVHDSLCTEEVVMCSDQQAVSYEGDDCVVDPVVCDPPADITADVRRSMDRLIYEEAVESAATRQGD